MTALTFTLREAPRQRVDLSPLVPERLAGLAPSDIGALELACGNGTVRAGDLFAIAGGDCQTLAFRGACDKLDRIGAGMRGGSISVAGDAGAFLGLGMAGGEIRVEGDAGAFAAAGMRGGFLHIAGSAGDFLGGARPGERFGMTGGLVLAGSAGDRTADSMRRGAILVEQDAGAYCGARMLAGTVAVLGSVGAGCGFLMRRGTVLLRQAPEILPTFNDGGRQALGFLTLLVNSWAALPGAFARLPPPGPVQRFLGDRGVGGLGEILILEGDES